ncbi:MAG: AAA family ATPase [Lachnospiraceae bacterium]
MLLQFSVTNHRSIKETATISMKASKDTSLRECLISPDGKKELVPVLALYGANAAGKSNVLHALTLMREMICGIFAQPLKAEKLPQEPFGFSGEDNKPTELDIIYFYKGIKYAYGVHGHSAFFWTDWIMAGISGSGIGSFSG